MRMIFGLNCLRHVNITQNQCIDLRVGEELGEELGEGEKQTEVGHRWGEEGPVKHHL